MGAIYSRVHLTSGESINTNGDEVLGDIIPVHLVHKMVYTIYSRSLCSVEGEECFTDYHKGRDIIQHRMILNYYGNSTRGIPITNQRSLSVFSGVQPLVVILDRGTDHLFVVDPVVFLSLKGVNFFVPLLFRVEAWNK